MADHNIEVALLELGAATDMRAIAVTELVAFQPKEKDHDEGGDWV